jgi:SAM-dependent methyltransferase
LRLLLAAPIEQSSLQKTRVYLATRWRRDRRRPPNARGATVERQAHWDAAYQTKGDRDSSWFEARPDVSLRMLDAARITREHCVLDVGGGDSRLVDALLARGFRCLAVLDVSPAALERSQRRLGTSASLVRWLAADVTGNWSVDPVDVWHDRAVFHFLVEAEDRRRYRDRLLATLKPGASAVISTFAEDGPERCSALPVRRYSPTGLAEELGSGFELLDSLTHQHFTPSGAQQSFQYSRFVKRA